MVKQEFSVPLMLMLRVDADWPERQDRKFPAREKPKGILDKHHLAKQFPMTKQEQGQFWTELWTTAEFVKNIMFQSARAIDIPEGLAY